jgi:hypothetical protein
MEFKMRTLAERGMRLLSAGVLVVGCSVGLTGCDEDPNGSGAGTVANTAPAAPAESASQERPTRTLPLDDPNRAPTLDEGAPPLVFEPAAFDMGHMSPGTIFNGAIRVINPTSAPIRITGSRASCNCTSIDLANTVLAPGEGADIALTFDSTGKLGPTNIHIRVTAEGYDTWAQTTIVGLVSLPVSAEPAYIITSPRAPGTASGFADLKSGTFTVSSIENQPFRILSSGGKEPLFADGFNPASDSPRSSYLITWDISEYDARTCKNSAGERIPSRWVIETDHPDCPLMDLQVRHPCSLGIFHSQNRQFRLAEGRVLVGKLAPGESTEVEVPVRWFPNATQSQQFIAATSESDEFTIQFVSQSGVGAGLKLKLRVTPDANHRGVFTGLARIDSANDVARLEIIGTVR